MKWVVVFVICASLKPQAYGGQPQTLQCKSFNNNYRDFIYDLTPLANTCAKVENSHAAAEQRLSTYLETVRQQMITETTRRYSLYTIKQAQDSSGKPEADRKTKRDADKAVFDKTIKDYNDVVGDSTKGYKKDVADLIQKLRPAMGQSCLKELQDAAIQQIVNSGALTEVLPRMCIDMQDAYKAFTTSLNSVYNQIGATRPT